MTTMNACCAAPSGRATRSREKCTGQPYVEFSNLERDEMRDSTLRHIDEIVRQLTA